MEKQRAKSRYRLFSRLLTRFFICTFFFFSSDFLFSQSFREKINSLEIVASENQNMYIKTDLKFEVEIPDVLPFSVQVKNTDFPDNVNLKSLRKFESFENNSATKLEFWLSFDKVGTYKFSKLPVLINGRTYYIRIRNVQIEENPENMNPRVVIVFKNGTTLYSDDFYSSKYYSEKTNSAIPVFDAKVGEKQEFTVYLQYAAQLIQFEWDLPKNSIFTQTKQFEITEVKYREKKFSKELIPVATFEWSGLAEGKMTFPEMNFVATGYKGYKTEITFPSYEINFVKGLNKSNSNSENSIYNNAFTFDDSFFETENNVYVTEEIAQNIADLRSKERNATFDYLVKVKEREKTEDFFGFDTSAKEFPVKLLYFCGFFVLLFLLVLIISAKRKKRITVIFASVFFAIFFVATMFCGFQASKKYGICVEGILQSVPEESASSKFEITGGNRVLISERSGEWVFIEYGDISGWIKEEFIIFIK